MKVFIELEKVNNKRQSIESHSLYQFIVCRVLLRVKLNLYLRDVTRLAVMFTSAHSISLFCTYNHVNV